MEIDGGSLVEIISGALSRKHTVEVRPSDCLYRSKDSEKSLLGNLWSGVSFISMMPSCLTRPSRSFDRDRPGEWNHLNFYDYTGI